jgi:hypothetical protein
MFFNLTGRESAANGNNHPFGQGAHATAQGLGT